MLLAYLVCFVFFAAVAMTINEGLWNNAIGLFCVVLGGLLGIFVGVPAGNLLGEQAGMSDDKAWFFVFAGVWGVFALSVLIMRLMFDRTSRTKMKFIPLIDKFAGPVVGLLMAIMFTSFATYTLDRIPIKAGQWKYADAADWQKSVFKYGRAPFLNVANAFAAGEGLDNTFVRK
ncbi:MAG: CvpA family protein [Bythopirellula sp.]|nr:CvpA family protein [Bythopirellula sp.]